MGNLYQYILMLVTVIGLLAGAYDSKAQQKTKITGLLQDSADGKPVAWATVGLYKAINTQKPLQNIFSNGKGKFEFTEVDTGHYVVIVTYTGFHEKEHPVKIDTGKLLVELEPIVLSPDARQLGTVVVTAAVRKPLLEQEDEKMIFNAEADPSVEGLTATDVLRKTPFVSVDGEGNVQLNGQTNFKVLLNGKETAMFTKNLKDAIRSFPASLIKKIEVSTTPSSKYDGEGVGGIINIITQKKIVGYNGNAGISYNTLRTYSGSASLNFKYGKFGLSAYYGAYNGRPPVSNLSSETESLNPVAFHKRISNGVNRGKYFYNYGNMELAWDMDSLNVLSLYAGLSGGNGNSTTDTRYDMVLPGNAGTETSYLSSSTRYDYPAYYLGLDYVRKFKKRKGKEFSLKAYYDDARDNNYFFSEQNTRNGDRFTVNDNQAPNKQITLNADFTQPFKNGSKMEAGLKSIFRQASSDYLSQIKYDKDQEYAEDIGNTNNFKYRQNVYSVFATYSFKWKNISFKLGSRFEQTHIVGDFSKTTTRVLQDYGTFMPNIYLSRRFSKIHTVSLSYTKRLRRPYIWDLNPFVSNVDSFNISYGNPKLGPDIIHIVEAGYSVFKGNTNINIRFSQSFSNRQIVTYTEFNEATGVAASVVDNAGISRVTGLNLNISTKFSKKLSFSLGSGLRYTFLKNRFRPDQRNDGIGGFGNTTLTYQATKKWAAYASGYYWISDPQLQGQAGRNFTHSIGTNYKLFKEKVTAGIVANNLFSKYYNWRSNYRDENFIRSNLRWNIQRAITFSLRWNFGKLTENVSRRRGVSNDDITK